MSEIVNKIKESKLETVDLESFLEGERIISLDLKSFLYKEMILKEKEFREKLKDHDWEQYDGAWLAVHCSSDAIIPSWAWMLVATNAAPFAKEVLYGSESDIREEILKRKIAEFDWESYKDRFVLLKGCSKARVPESAYVNATIRLLPVAGKLMYGEACSHVPVYRKPRK
jgi:hypothetical protein